MIRVVINDDRYREIFIRYSGKDYRAPYGSSIYMKNTILQDIDMRFFTSGYKFDILCDSKELPVGLNGVSDVLGSNFLEVYCDPSYNFASELRAKFGTPDVRFGIVDSRNNVIYPTVEPTGGNYNQLSNKPQINGVSLYGNKTPKQLGLASEDDVDSINTRLSEVKDVVKVLDAKFPYYVSRDFVTDKLNGKVDVEKYVNRNKAEVYKVLSEKDYTEGDQITVDLARKQLEGIDVKSTLQMQLNSKVDKIEGKGLSANDLTDYLADKLARLPNVDTEADYDIAESNKKTLEQVIDDRSVKAIEADYGKGLTFISNRQADLDSVLSIFYNIDKHYNTVTGIQRLADDISAVLSSLDNNRVTLLNRIDDALTDLYKVIGDDYFDVTGALTKDSVDSISNRLREMIPPTIIPLEKFGEAVDKSYDKNVVLSAHATYTNILTRLPIEKVKTIVSIEDNDPQAVPNVKAIIDYRNSQWDKHVTDIKTTDGSDSSIKIPTEHLVQIMIAEVDAKWMEILKDIRSDYINLTDRVTAIDEKIDTHIAKNRAELDGIHSDITSNANEIANAFIEINKTNVTVSGIRTDLDIATANIGNEIERAVAAEQVLTDDIKSEIDRATAREDEIEGKMTSMNSDLEAKITAAVTDEKNRAVLKETELESAITVNKADADTKIGLLESTTSGAISNLRFTADSEHINIHTTTINGTASDNDILPNATNENAGIISSETYGKINHLFTEYGNRSVISELSGKDDKIDVVSEKLLVDELDKKLNKTNVLKEWSEFPDKSDIEVYNANTITNRINREAEDRSIADIAINDKHNKLREEFDNLDVEGQIRSHIKSELDESENQIDTYSIDYQNKTTNLLHAKVDAAFADLTEKLDTKVDLEKYEVEVVKKDEFNDTITDVNNRIVEGDALALSDSKDYTDSKISELDLDSKVDKEEGKGLSSNDFTKELKEKLEVLPHIRTTVNQEKWEKYIVDSNVPLYTILNGRTGSYDYRDADIGVEDTEHLGWFWTGYVQKKNGYSLIKDDLVKKIEEKVREEDDLEYKLYSPDDSIRIERNERLRKTSVHVDIKNPVPNPPAIMGEYVLRASVAEDGSFTMNWVPVTLENPEN